MSQCFESSLTTKNTDLTKQNGIKTEKTESDVNYDG